jgi:hypothetical protein
MANVDAGQGARAAGSEAVGDHGPGGPACAKIRHLWQVRVVAGP